MFLSRFKLTAGNTTFTLTYVIALAVVAGLSIATHVILGIVISDQREVAQIVNRTGRQRMLSQRIAWLAPHYAETGDPATRAHLRNTITEMGVSARRLRNGGSKSDTPSSLPPSIAKIYREEDVTRRVDAYLFHAQAVADTDIPAGTGCAPEKAQRSSISARF